MSYILDALRRADSERERGRVPGIHAQTLTVESAETPSRSEPRPWVWGVVGVSIGLLLALGWVLFGRDAPASADIAANVPPPPIPITERASPVPAASPAAPEPAPIVAAATERPIEQKPTASELQAAARKPAVPAASAAASPASAAEARVYARHELPDEIRNQLPALAVSGSIYSPNPANRFVIINGQVVHEKGEVAPGHVLEQIKLKAAVLRFKNYRYEITY
jgi:general secretion pathway protein B